MAEVKVQVRAETKTAEDALKRAQQLADALGKKQTTIKIDSKSVDGVTKKFRIIQNEAAKIKMDSGVFNAYINGATSLDKALEGVQQETKKTSSVFSTLTQRFTAANLISTAVTRSLSGMRQALREAVSELKEMDKELTTIKMVTGASNYDISKLTKQAYAGAWDNGRSVNDYLTAAERFARAGYRENIDQLSKLSLLTQNIGGVEEDTAAKFLLAADAAWKLNGSYDSLMGVLDGVSAVADQNATDLGKIAEGITVAGSAFANAGESAQTFTAMLGVTTASTQRSGSEMARGLRTILFRVRQVKAELDDGEVISADDISNAAKALDKVGISVMDDTGKLKSMSDILSELNAKWKTWDEGDWRKSYLQNFLAGNRNGNVLYALMDNWGAYEKMLQQYEESAGTALEKNEGFLTGWESATNRLKSSWTELVGMATRDGGLIVSLTNQMADILHESAKEPWYYKYLKDEPWLQELLGININESGEAAEEASNKIKDYSDATMGAGDAADDAADDVDKLTNAFDKQRDKISEVAKAIKEEKNDAVNSLADIYKAAMDAADKGYYGSNAFNQGGGLFFSDSGLETLRKGGQLSAREYLDAYFKEIDSGDYSTAAANFFGKITGGSNEIKDKNKQVIASMKDLGDSFEWTFDKGSLSMDEYLQTLSSKTGISETFWASMIESLGMYSDELAKWTENDGKIKVDASEAKDEIDEVQEKRDNLEDKEITISADAEPALTPIGAVQEARDNLEDKTITITVNTVQSGDYNKPFSENDDSFIVSGHTVTGKKTSAKAWVKHKNTGSTASDLGLITDTFGSEAGGKRDNYSGIALVNDEYPANGSTPELIISKSSGTAYIANGGKPALVNLASDDIVLTASETRSAFGVPGFRVGKNLIGSGKSKKSSSITTTIGKTATTGVVSGTTAAESASDPTDTWNQLKKLIDYMVEEQKGILDQNLKVLDEQLAELEATRKAQKEEDELSEKQLAVDEALLDLQKAQNERTIRYYNESTHQWEWMADQGVLAQAEEAYSDALKELKDFLSELDFNEQKAAIQAQKDALQEAFDAYKEGWDTIVKSIEKPTGDLAALFEELKVNGTDAMKAQAGNIESLLGALEVGFFYGIGDVTDAATSGVTTVVQKANDFLESVKKTEAATAAEKSAVKTSSGGGGGSGGGSVLSSTTGSAASKTVASVLSNVAGQVQGAASIITKAEAGSLTYQSSTGGSTVNNNGNNTYINGVKIGGDSLSQPLGKVLATLNLHANYTR